MPAGGNTHSSAELAKILKIVEKSGLRYQFTPSSTCIEGEWDDIMPLIRRCHDKARKGFPHVITFIKIEEDEGERDKLAGNISSVERKLGHALNTEPKTI